MELGIIEGYFGTPWSWAERRETMEFLAPHGYRFFLYAPKADAWLRRDWRTPHPEPVAAEIAAFGAACRRAGVRFGVGLSPYEAYLDFDAAAEAALVAKLAALDRMGIDDLAILFDDMRGDLPDLAERQARIVDFAAARTRASRLIVCPSYYSDDPVLDRVFGRRPVGYLETLGRLLDPDVEMFWTGEEVCSREISPGHIDRVAEAMRRRPFLWDNYPVNDGQRLSQHLHLRGFTGRPAALAGRLSAHAVNPALQPALTRIPLLTLPESYRDGDAYRYGDAFRRAAGAVLGEELATLVRDDLLTLQEVPLDLLGEKAGQLRGRYEGRPEPGAREIMAWLDGRYRISHALVQTQ
ncbi:MAG TPA: beta-N-acetylglucosaminidase domain-containing protein [Azospirillaceae bacterium]|nr:beta-N-acetylglucosaminidase domain-containing protein [Azospirillaceae bacterium]